MSVKFNSNLMKTKRSIIIIGGGFSGMVTSYFASKFFKNYKIYLIEKNNSLGGLYNSINFKRKFFFDHGMHLFYQCKNKIINNFFFKILRKSQWIILKGVKKDIAGVFYNGKLNTSSPYINLEGIGFKHKINYLEDIHKTLSNKKLYEKDNSLTLEKYFFQRFGKKLTQKIIEPIIKKFWGFDSKKIDVVASKLILMDRVNLFKKEIMDKLIFSNFFRSRFGYPEQLRLPKKFYSKQTYGLYPKKFGMLNVIKKLEELLIKSKVCIRLGNTIDSIKINKKKITEMMILKNSSFEKIKNISYIFWTVPIFGLVPLLGLKLKNLEFDKNKKQVFVYLLSKERPKMGGNYYFMCFDKGFATFRVTSYAEYCPDSKKLNKYYPLCVEMHFDEGKKKLNYKKIALRELSKFKLFNKMNSIKYIFVEKANGFFPILTLKNTLSLKKIKNKFLSLNLKNIFLTTQSPEKGIFYMHEVLDQNINLLYKLKNDKVKN